MTILKRKGNNRIFNFMMDYYSQFPGPEINIREKNLMDYAINLKLIGIKLLKLPEIVKQVISEVPSYSMTGYEVFGKHEEIKKLNDLLKQFN